MSFIPADQYCSNLIRRSSACGSTVARGANECTAIRAMTHAAINAPLLPCVCSVAHVVPCEHGRPFHRDAQNRPLAAPMAAITTTESLATRPFRPLVGSVRCLCALAHIRRASGPAIIGL
jgi:hypothetical protein